MHPMAARPALIEGGGEMLPQFPVQGVVVKDVEPFLEALFTRMAMIGIEHQTIFPGWPGSAGWFAGYHRQV
ncbi:hypothetical protein GCM10027214_00020 [Stenotrophomonas tumulicola]